MPHTREVHAMLFWTVRQEGAVALVVNVTFLTWSVARVWLVCYGFPHDEHTPYTQIDV